VQAEFIDRLTFLVPRRCIAIDLGRSHIKILLAERTHQTLRILDHQMISLQEEGLISPEEINQHLHLSIATYGNYPVVLVIPQHQAISQVVDLPQTDNRHLHELIEEETIRLSGLSESSIIYDHAPLNPFGKFQNPFWITITRERELEGLVDKLAAGGVTFSGITTSANALASAYLYSALPSDRVVLADLGATSTTVAILVQGQNIQVSSIPIGSESFTEAIAGARGCTFEEAETIKRTHNLFQGDHRLPALLEVLDTWLREFEKCLREWMEDNTDLEGKLQPFRIIFTGGGSTQLGLLPYLHSRSVFEFQKWPEPTPLGWNVPLDRYAIACGALVEAFNPSHRHCSLLPETMRTQRKRHDQLVLVNVLSLILLGLLLVLMLAGSIHKALVTARKTDLLEDAQAAWKKAQGVDSLIHQRDLEYASVLPVLQRKRTTLDFLQILDSLQKIRMQKNLWFVLLSDQNSYASGSPLVSYGLNPTNLNEHFELMGKPPASNLFVLELCIPDAGGEKLKPLNDLVADMKKTTLFRKVDILPASQRTNLVDPKTVLPDRHHALAVELAEAPLFEPNLNSRSRTNKSTVTSKTKP
jgi:Tfp pilus assembly PilM family ATPase